MTLPAAAACAVLLVVSSFSPAAQPSATASADAKELREYTLTMDALKQFAAATRHIAEAVKADPRYARLLKLQGELKALEDKDDPSDADLARMEEIAQQIEVLEHDVPDVAVDGTDASLSDMEAAMRKEPILMNALSRAGMSPRDYAKFSLAFFQAAMLHGMQKAGLVKEVPKELRDSVNMANVAFVDAHQAEISALMAEMEKLSKPQ